MSLQQAIIEVIQHARNQTLKLVVDLSDEQLCAQPAPATNHAAWVLGHLLVVDYGFLGVLTGKPLPSWIDQTMRATYGARSRPVAERSLYQSKQWYVERLASVHEQILNALRTLTDDRLNAPHPDPDRRQRFPTIAHVIPFYGIWHESYHAGLLSAWRRVQGLPPV